MALVSAPRSNQNANVMLYWDGDAAPTNGTNGTLAAVAEKGALYRDLTNANLYINVGTQASPDWRLFTHA